MLRALEPSSQLHPYLTNTRKQEFDFLILMSSRRSNSYGNGGGHNRNSFRDNNQRQAQKPNHGISINLF
jgi:hypothetical protein